MQSVPPFPSPSRKKQTKISNNEETAPALIGYVLSEWLCDCLSNNPITMNPLDSWQTGELQSAPQCFSNSLGGLGALPIFVSNFQQLIKVKRSKRVSKCPVQLPVTAPWAGGSPSLRCGTSVCLSAGGSIKRGGHTVCSSPRGSGAAIWPSGGGSLALTSASANSTMRVRGAERERVEMKNSLTCLLRSVPRP